LKNTLTLAAALLLQATTLFAQNDLFGKKDHARTYQSPGMVSLGTRNTFSMFNDDKAIGKGIGGQYRIQLTRKLGSEWFLDYISSKNGTITFRNDYHIGWSVMYYPLPDNGKDRIIQPYILAGHCFDYSRVMEQKNRSNYAARWSMAAQTGLGTHINITDRLDCSVSGQYMLHFGKDIETSIDDKSTVMIEKKNTSTPDGHLLLSVGFNYKFFHLW
jgi:hypothetical protein